MERNNRFKQDASERVGEIGWYAKFATYGDIRVRYCDPVIIFRESPSEAEASFIRLQKRVPDSWGLGSFQKDLYWFLTSQQAHEFFSSRGCDNVVFW
jgi:hypothetical protein